jgi:eukaryotic-like serine/threonine-protein kinase
MPRPPVIGDTIDEKYEIIEAFEPGGMGLVFKVRSITTEKLRALKLCKFSDTDMCRRFAREVRMMQKIDHPNVVRILAAGLEHEPPYFVMPLAMNSLADEIGELKEDENKAIGAFLEICKGVVAIHEAGVVHRDIKPANALRLKDGTIAISDLGLAKLVERDTTILTQTHMIVGTDAYLAPEQRLPDGSRHADEKTDVYQLGKTLYEFVTGRTPAFIGLSGLPPGMARIIRRATREDPAERFASVADLVTALEQYVRSNDPKFSTRNALEKLVEDAKTGDGVDVGELCQLLSQSHEMNKELFCELFDQIPDAILIKAAKKFPDLFAEALTIYLSALDETASSQSFSYAEGVASSMESVFGNVKSADIRAKALVCAMVAACRLNRFAAMDTCNSMLSSVKDDETAYALVDLVSDRAGITEFMERRPDYQKFHPVIRIYLEKSTDESTE